jgi:hypothetical protein
MKKLGFETPEKRSEQRLKSWNAWNNGDTWKSLDDWISRKPNCPCANALLWTFSAQRREF